MGALSNPISFAIRISKQFLDPGKVIFGHFIDFGHFPIEIPIEAEFFGEGLPIQPERKQKLF